MDVSHWEAYYQRGDWPWDVGGVTPALIEWLKQHPVRGLSVLVPGCGRGHDAAFLSKAGAKVFAVDYAADALAEAQRLYPKSRVAWLQADVTTLKLAQPVDLVWEYTCFCALQPPLRAAYVARIAEALKPGGTYLGMVFLKVPNPEDGPPFEIAPDAFRQLLSSFQIEVFEPHTPRSLKQRHPNEIWFEARRESARPEDER